MAGGLVVMVALPRLTTAVPAPLVAIVLTTVAAVTLPDSLPSLSWPDVPWTLGTLRIIAPYPLGVTLAKGWPTWSRGCSAAWAAAR